MVKVWSSGLGTSSVKEMDLVKGEFAWTGEGTRVGAKVGREEGTKGGISSK